MKMSQTCFSPKKCLFLLVMIFFALFSLPGQAQTSGCVNKGGTPEFDIGTMILALANGGKVESPTITWNISCYNGFGQGSVPLLTINPVNTAELSRYGLTLSLVVSNYLVYDLSKHSSLSLDYVESGAAFEKSYSLQLRVSSDGKFGAAFKNVQVPAINSLISASFTEGGTSASINSRAFYLTYTPKCFGKVDITPQAIAFGRVYTFQTQIQKQASFKVTASRDTSCLSAGVNDSYDFFTLYAAMSSAGDTTGDGSALLLRDTDNAPNGLSLSISDDATGQNIPLNGTPASFGPLIRGPGNNAMAYKQYTARLNLTGQPLKTGPFAADVVVTITYQ